MKYGRNLSRVLQAVRGWDSAGYGRNYLGILQVVNGRDVRKILRMEAR